MGLTEEHHLVEAFVFNGSDKPFRVQHEHPSQWAAIRSVAEKLGCTVEALRRWVRQAERDQGRASCEAARGWSPRKTMGRPNRCSAWPDIGCRGRYDGSDRRTRRHSAHRSLGPERRGRSPCGATTTRAKIGPPLRGDQGKAADCVATLARAISPPRAPLLVSCFSLVITILAVVKVGPLAHHEAILAARHYCCARQLGLLARCRTGAQPDAAAVRHDLLRQAGHCGEPRG